MLNQSGDRGSWANPPKGEQMKLEDLLLESLRYHFREIKRLGGRTLYEWMNQTSIGASIQKPIA
jgi:hypothetical protein